MSRFLILGRALLLGLALGGSAAHGAKVRIGFTEIAGPAPESAPLFTGKLAEASKAILARYSAEEGFRALAYGADKDMIVVTTFGLRYSRAIWNKMVNNGDATIEAGLGYFQYKADGEEAASYYYLGSLYMDQGASGYLRFWQPAMLKKYMIQVHKDCSVTGSSVLKSNPQEFIKSTVLTHTERVGNKFQYHYVVNGGQGTQLSAIWVGFAGTNKLFVISNCEASVYQELGGSLPIPEAAPQP